MTADTIGLISEQYGAPVEEFTGGLVATAGTTAARVLPQDPRRLAFIIVNTSANTIYVMHDQAASATLGVQLSPGSSLSVAWRDDLTLPTREWWIAASVDASTFTLIGVRFAQATQSAPSRAIL